MNSIIGFSELAMDGVSSEKTKGYLNKIIENSNWLLEILNNVLDISKFEAGKMEMESVPFELHDIFTYCQTVTMPKAMEKGLHLYFYAEPTIGKKLFGDPTRLRQVFVNLLSNAVKFTNVGTVKLSSFITDSNDDSVTICFEVRDSGIGMTPEQMTKIFEPFMQADSSMTRLHGGTGLGLSITKNIIELMGGRLSVESTPKIGSKFSFELTFRTKDMPVDVSAPEAAAIELEKPYFEGEILVCEDNLMNQRVIYEHLARVGLRATMASNGREGIEKVRDRVTRGEKPFDLIFMDIHMPIMDGLEAAPEIAALNTGTPIVAMTANIMATDMEMYKISGIPDCVTKPFTSQELWSCLLKYLTPVSRKDAKEDKSPLDDDQLQAQLMADFVKGNQSTFGDIVKALDTGDIKTAHRLAHTLKSSAAHIGKLQLQQAAAGVELSLMGEKNSLTEGQLGLLETELNAALRELAPLLRDAESEVAAEPVDTAKALELFEQLEALLKRGNPDCLNLIGGLRAIPGSGNLIRQMNDFKFRPALKSLAELKRVLGEKQ
jgi:CheY-like chemotaxis protein